MLVHPPAAWIEQGDAQWKEDNRPQTSEEARMAIGHLPDLSGMENRYQDILFSVTDTVTIARKKEEVPPEEIPLWGHTAPESTATAPPEASAAAKKSRVAPKPKAKPPPHSFSKREASSPRGLCG